MALPHYKWNMLRFTVPRSAATKIRRWQSAGKDGKAVEQSALLLAEQKVAPVDERSESLMAQRCRSAATGQQPEAVVQAVCDLLRG